MAIEYDIHKSWGYFTGDDKRLRMRIAVDGSVLADILDGTADRENTVGWSLSWMVKRHKTDDDDAAIITKTSPLGIVAVDASAGEWDVVLSASDVALILGDRQYWHELKRTNAGFKTVLTQGRFTLRQSVHE